MSTIRLRDTPIYFDDVLSTKVVKLPLDYPILALEHSHVRPDEKFKSNLTKDGGFLTLTDSVINTLSYRIRNDERNVIITPLNLANPMNLQFQQLHFVLPDPVVSNCFSISQDIASETIHVDFILTSNIFISLKLGYADFIVGAKQDSLSMEHFNSWGKISLPFDFNVRPAHLLKAINHSNLIISLQDGGLLNLRRDSFDADFEIFHFNDASFLNFNNFFRFNKSEKLIGSEHIGVKTVVDVVGSGSYLFSLSINKDLKVWSLETHSLIIIKNLKNILPSEYEKVYLDVNPMKLLQMVEFNGATYIATLFSLDSGYLKLWEFDSNRLTLNETEISLNPQLPDGSSVWLIQDYTINATSRGEIELYLLWKSNTSSVIQHYTITASGDIQVIRSESNDLISNSIFVPGAKNEQSHSEFYVDKLFNSCNYNETILSTSLSVFEDFYNNESEDTNYQLKDKILMVLNKHLHNTQNYNKDVINQWKRFDALCDEFKKKSQEAISMKLDANGYLYVLKGLDYSIYRAVSDLELLYFNQQGSSIASNQIKYADETLQFMRILNFFKNKFSQKTLSNIYYSLFENDQLDSREKINSIYEEYLQERINSYELNELMQQLSELPNLLDIMSFITDVTRLDETRAHLNDTDKFGSNLIINSIRQLIDVHSTLVFQILLVCLAVETNDEIVKIFNKLRGILYHYKRFDELQKININESQKLELDHINVNLNSLGYSIFRKFRGGSIVPNNNSNELFSAFFNFMNDDNFIILATVELVNLDLPDIIKNSLFEFLPANTPINILLTGITYYLNGEADKFFSYFDSNSRSVYEFQLSSQDLLNLKYLDQSYLSFFNTTNVEYYHRLSSLAQKSEMHQVALRFEVKAAKYNPETRVLEDDELNLSVFKLALRVLDFELAYTSLLNLSPVEARGNEKLYTLEGEAFVKSYDYNKLISEFVNKLFEAGDIKKLIGFPFVNCISIIDNILVQLAKDEPLSKKSLTYYKVLYSWRLNNSDSRGACESLYMFIDRFRKFSKTSSKDESSIENKVQQLEIKKLNVVIAELYIIILNLLNTLSETDDKWILKYGDENELMKIGTLQKEYSDWMRKLESDLVN